MENILDLIIIGSGPAGLTAGIYASRAELNALVIEKNMVSGGQIINTYEVDNYPGIPGVSGYDLATKFREHCEQLSVQFIDGDVTEFKLDGDIKVLTLENGEKYCAKAVIIATGAKPRNLGIKGEKELSGMGVSYCATCDGAFFRNKETAVVGGGDVAIEDAIFLARLCKKVYVIHRRNEFRAAKSLVSKLNSMENVEIIWDSTVEEVLGNVMVEGIIVQNVKTNEKRTISLSGIFVAIGYEPSSQVYEKVVDTDNRGYIIADESCETSVPGIFAAGDIRTKPLKQIITAASDGANAVTAVEKYINQL
ncbi:thioredoxin-disulfide reductase [Anaeromicropila populeti]|uniref:Thioredoxin reductase n=1 Tax=Anaeromicropila populeti TaxID=37658 RepID=A0A1I6J2Y4_9FIRM|nr:thioredoxin-disulfide reductase [Anaeromicropila populeti]SFR73375.1 thioredoxin reductase (NADPH) [Anaeromicropila populeti]